MLVWPGCIIVRIRFFASFGNVSFYRQVVKQCTNIFNRGACDSRVKCRFIDFLQRKIRALLRHVVQEKLFQLCKPVQNLCGTVFGIRFQNVCGHIHAVGKKSFLPHQIDGRNHILFRNSQHIRKIIHPRFRIVISGSCNASAGYEGFDNPLGIFFLFPIKSRRTLDFE